MQNLDLGSAVIDVDYPIVAGSYQTITFTYTAGHPIDDCGYLKIVFRFAGDFGAPQFDHPIPVVAALRVEDRWGNPVGPVQQISHPCFSEPGVQRLSMADTDTGLAAQSKPIRIVARPTDLRTYWGVLHGQSEETIGSNSIDG